MGPPSAQWMMWWASHQRRGAPHLSMTQPRLRRVVSFSAVDVRLEVLVSPFDEVDRVED